MYNNERLVVNLSRKASEALAEIMDDKEMKKTDAVIWALKYANTLRKMAGEEGSVLIEKDGNLERYRFM